MEDLLVRQAGIDDRQAIANLLYFEVYVHRHLDWRSPLEWLGAPEFWVAEHHGHIVAAFASPEEPPGIAWVRLFAHTSQFDRMTAWDMLWATAKKQLVQSGNPRVACIATETWLQELLQVQGFTHIQDIVFLEWKDSPLPVCNLPDGMRLRPMQIDDLPAVAELDAAAFAPLWHNSLQILQDAYSQSMFATVIESEAGIRAYQISTQSPYSIHLARLAVWPETQGQGLGSALTIDLLQRALREGLRRVSVNTQSDNLASLALYTKLGFQFTGRHYPVYGFDISVL